MKERTIFSMFIALLIVSFLPFFSFFPETPSLALAWILADMVAFATLLIILIMSNYNELRKEGL